MSEQQHHTHSPDPPVVQAMCPLCQVPMRLLMMIPAAVSETQKDTLVFNCDCGNTEHRTMDKK